MSKLIDKFAIKAIQDCIDGGEVNVTSLDITDGMRIRIDKIRIQYKSDSAPILYFDEDMGANYYKEWISDVGKIVRKDFYRHNVDCYCILRFNKSSVLLRRLEPEELDIMELDNMPIINMADYNYIIIKVMSSKYELCEFSYRFNGKIDVDVEEEPEIEGDTSFTTLFDDESINQ